MSIWLFDLPIKVYVCCSFQSIQLSFLLLQILLLILTLPICWVGWTSSPGKIMWRWWWPKDPYLKRLGIILVKAPRDSSKLWSNILQKMIRLWGFCLKIRRQKNNLRSPLTSFCKKVGHVKKECSKYVTWRERKGNFLIFIYSEINLVFVPKDTWWVDYGVTTHISMFMHSCMWSRSTSDTERFIYVGDDNKVAVEAMGTLRLLLLKIGFHLDLDETFVTPYIRRI